METVLQYNADHTRLVKHIFQFLQDTQVYGLGILRTMWREDFAMRTRRVKVEKRTLFGRKLDDEFEIEREEELVYEGNETVAQDPFMFFPDPNVPMTEVNRRGEYVFWRNFDGKHLLLRLEADGTFKWVKESPVGLPQSKTSLGAGASGRSLLSRGTPTPGLDGFNNHRQRGADYMQVDQGTIILIPRELGLGESERPEKWLVTIINKAQIVQIEPFNADHDLHPVSVSEPYTLGYGFGQPGMMDYLGPIQDVISWLINSHMDNVRKVINDVLIVDPSAIEMQDLRNSGPGKTIRLKRAALGRDVRTIVNQLAVTDVTQGHIADMQLFITIGQMLSAVANATLGLGKGKSSRATATEIRSETENAASRLASQGKIISAQAMVDHTMMWSLNVQQNISDEFILQIMGENGLSSPIRITPDMLTGDFNYPIHDGTLPIDKIALLDQWKEIFKTVLEDQELRSTYNVPRLFEFIAKLGGAENISGMKVSVQSDESVERGVQAGTLAPVGEVGKQSQLTQAVEPKPGNRAAGGL